MKKTILFALVVLAAAGLAGAQSLGNTTKTVHLSGQVRWTQCAFGPDGVLHVILLEDLSGGDPVWYFSYDGVKASALVNLSDSLTIKAQQPSIHVSSRGVVYALWGQTSTNSIIMRTYDPVAKAWGPKEVICDYARDEPMAGTDAEGNLHTFFYTDSSLRVYNRSKINGVWEEIKKINSGPGKGGGIAVTADGTAYAIWNEKASWGYKGWWSKRTKTGAWQAAQQIVSPGSISHPNIAAGPNGTAIVVWSDIDPVLENGSDIRYLRLGTGEPLQIIIPFAMQHYPRITVDKDNASHVVVQIGGGDWGDGFRYTNNAAGTWRTLQTALTTWPKIQGIAADPFGNVAVTSSSVVDGGGGSDIYLYSLRPIQSHYFYPPLNLSQTIQIKSVRKSPQVVHRLAWTANPSNEADFIQGYNIYVKEGTGAYQKLIQVAKSATGADLAFTDLSKKRKFAVTTVSLGGGETQLTEF